MLDEKLSNNCFLFPSSFAIVFANSKSNFRINLTISLFVLSLYIFDFPIFLVSMINLFYHLRDYPVQSWSTYSCILRQITYVIIIIWMIPKKSSIFACGLSPNISLNIFVYEMQVYIFTNL